MLYLITLDFIALLGQACIAVSHIADAATHIQLRGKVESAVFDGLHFPTSNFLYLQSHPSEFF
jgi:hypothetical protein